MFLIVGLGNPVIKYKNTKHNFGFLLADQICADFKFESLGNKFGGEILSGLINDQKCLILKPMEYMNCSGASILSCSSFYKIPKDKIIVLHDDLDLEFGRIKAKIGGGHAGHNGLRDIDEKIGKEYTRIRLGIGRPENPAYEISDYVLSKFSEKELEEIEKINHKIIKNLPLVLEGKLSEFMNQLSKN